MISIGNDLVYIPRLEKVLTEDFKKRVFTDSELEDIESHGKPIERFASTFAAKEAVYKAVKAVRPKFEMKWKNIQISRPGFGKPPLVVIDPEVSSLEVSLSLTHEKDYAFATALVQDHSKENLRTYEDR